MAKSEKQRNIRRESPVVGYFTRLEIENIKSFGPRQVLNLSGEDGKFANWTIILGENGVGKTTLLQALAMAEPSENDRYSDDEKHFRELDIIPRIIARSGFKFKDWARKTGVSGNINVRIQHFSNKPKNQRQFEDVSFVLHAPGNEKGASPRFAGVLFRADPKLRKLTNPIVTYGAHRHVQEDTGSPAHSYYEDILGFKQTTMAENWLIDLDYKRSKQSKVRRRAEALFLQVKSALIELLPDVTDIRIPQFDNVREAIEVEFKTPYGWVKFDELGYGYRSFVGWVIDLASRLFSHYPNSTNPLARPAVALIDEIDLHMHPSWQREVMDFLSERFPKTQFIATAHSPLIVQAAMGRANVAVIRREGDHAVIDQSLQSVEGWRLDQILTSDLFGLETARPPAYEEAIRERKRILSKPRLNDKDKEKLKIYNAMVHSMPVGETSEDIEAMELVRRAADALKNKAG